MTFDVKLAKLMDEKGWKPAELARRLKTKDSSVQR